MRSIFTCAVACTILSAGGPAAAKSSGAGAATKAWLQAACDRLLGGSRVKETPEHERVLHHLNAQIDHQNRFTRHRMDAELRRLKEIAGQPTGIAVESQLSPDFVWIDKPVLQAIVNPAALNLKWADELNTLADSKALVLLFDDVEVQTSTGRFRLTDIMAEEARYVSERNPALQFELRFTVAQEFADLAFAPEHHDKLVMWVKGPVENFQQKRLVLLMLEHAFEALANDRAFVRPKIK